MRSLLIALIFGNGLAFGQNWEVFDMATAGLPSNTCNAIEVAPNGDIWVGTDWGLCRYDGVQWDIFQVGTSQLPDNDIRALAVDTLGRVWIGTFIGGLIMFDESTSNWTIYNTSNSLLPEDQIRCIEVDENNIIWVCTTGGLARINGSDWRVYDDSPSSYNGLQLPGNNIASVAVRSDSLICIGTLNAGYTYLTDTSVTVYTTFQDGLPDNTALGTTLDPNGDRWAACPAGGLLFHPGTFSANNWFQYSTASSGIPSNSLNDVVVDDLGVKYIGSQAAGLILFSGLSTWVNYSTMNSAIPDNDVREVALDANGDVWVATFLGGAARLQLPTGMIDRAAMTLSVFPNPTTDRAVLQHAMGEQGRYSILDAHGRTVRQDALDPSGRTLLSVSGLDQGVYLVRIHTFGGRSAVARVLVD